MTNEPIRFTAGADIKAGETVMVDSETGMLVPWKSRVVVEVKSDDTVIAHVSDPSPFHYPKCLRKECPISRPHCHFQDWDAQQRVQEQMETWDGS